MTTIDKLKAARAALVAKIEASDPRAQLAELDSQIAAEERAAREAELEELRRRRLEAGQRLAQAAAFEQAARAALDNPANMIVAGMPDTAIEARAKAAGDIERAHVLQALATHDLIGLSAAVNAAEEAVK